MKLLVIEPFYTGSHKQWLDGLVKHVGLEITTITLPGKLWKWRTESSAFRIAEKYLALNTQFDCILCSGFFNLAVFKSFVLKEKAKIAPCYMYMHENQISYPWSGTDPDPALRRDQHYGFIDLMNVFLADKVFFNSHFHRNSFLQALPDFTNQFPEDYFSKRLHELDSKSSVLPIGLELEQFKVSDFKTNTNPIILWNHRWEYDKNPELFFQSLFELKEEGTRFKLIVLGERYKNSPDIFNEAEIKLAEEIIHFGYAKSREVYCRMLKQADILPVTSKHDFFGISVVEAIAASCVPLLPLDLSYPEHISHDNYPELFYHDPKDYLPKLRTLLKTYKNHKDLNTNIMKYDWQNLKMMYSQALEQTNPM